MAKAIIKNDNLLKACFPYSGSAFSAKDAAAKIAEAVGAAETNRHITRTTRGGGARTRSALSMRWSQHFLKALCRLADLSPVLRFLEDGLPLN